VRFADPGDFALRRDYGGRALAGASRSPSTFLIPHRSPIIFGAAVLEVPKTLHQDAAGISALAIGSGAVAGLVAFVSVWMLMRYFKMRDFQALNPSPITAGRSDLWRFPYWYSRRDSSISAKGMLI
jgi:hypothetical protein